MVSVLGGAYNVLLRTIFADTYDGGLKDSKDHTPVGRPVCIGEGFGIRHTERPLLQAPKTSFRRSPGLCQAMCC